MYLPYLDEMKDQSNQIKSNNNNGRGICRQPCCRAALVGIVMMIMSMSGQLNGNTAMTKHSTQEIIASSITTFKAGNVNVVSSAIVISGIHKDDPKKRGKDIPDISAGFDSYECKFQNQKDDPDPHENDTSVFGVAAFVVVW